ncbi:MAG TPA: hypothetical protein ENH01_10935 [Nitrospirae bacterium]|nr:hypothetical protein [Nitrospirota bacterium]
MECPGALYQITIRGDERRKIFRDKTDRTTFLNILRDYHDRFGILLHSYVLMDNHYLESVYKLLFFIFVIPEVCSRVSGIH